MQALHGTSLADVLAEHARSRPMATATVDGARRATYRELDERVDRCAAALRAAGAGPRERVLWLGQNSDRVVELLLACARIGAMLCPANWRGSPEELAFVLDDLAPVVVVHQDAEIGDRVAAARATAATRCEWWHHDGEGDDSYESALARSSGRPDGHGPRTPHAPIDPGEPLLALYTAAFEGRPAAAMLSHRALLTQAVQWAALGEIDHGSVFLNSGPMFHIANWWWTLATLATGGTNVFTPRVDAEELCRLIEHERCTGAYLVGPMFDQILEVNRDGRFDLSSLRTHAGRSEWDAMTSPDTSRWGLHPGGYGQTELVGMLTFNALGVGATGTHGRPSPWMQVRIVDPEGDDVPDGETGEIVARGPMVMNGYWNRPEENAHRSRGGWHHTRDLGRRHPDGSITFVGTATRMIKSAAENIYPVEVERCIAELAAVKECAVIGVPDPVWTQSVKAIVVTDEHAPVDAETIIDHCRSRIASYKKPRSVEFVDELPRVGWAVDYDALDARFGGGGYPGGTNRSA